MIIKFTKGITAITSNFIALEPEGDIEIPDSVFIEAINVRYKGVDEVHADLILLIDEKANRGKLINSKTKEVLYSDLKLLANKSGYTIRDLLYR